MKENENGTLRQEASLLSWCFLGPCALLAWILGLDQAAPWLPFLVSIVFLGLPHGAADWLLLAPGSKKSATRAFLLYSAAGLGIAALAWFFPRIAVVGFLLLTIVHFGLADERDLRSFERAPSRSRIPRLGGIARMAAFLSLVCLLGPGEVASLFGRVERLLGATGRPSPPTEIVASSALLSVFLLSSLLWIISLVGVVSDRLRPGPSGAGRRVEVEIGEGALLFAIAAALHPVFAIGIYFLCWHAWRHCILVARRQGSRDGRNRLWKELARLHIRSWPLSLPVVPLMLGLVLWNGSPGSPWDWIASLLVVCIIFTLPHHGIVEWKLGREHSRSKKLRTVGAGGLSREDHRRPSPPPRSDRTDSGVDRLPLVP